VPAPRAPEPGAGYDAAGPREYPPATAVISGIDRVGSVGEVDMLGPAPFIQLPVDWAALGTAVHAFMAADRSGMEGGERLAMATAVLGRWSVQGALRAEELLAASDALRGWAARRWPAATWHREWPVRMRQEGGTELIGYADLVLVDGDSFVLVDYKCLGGSRDDALVSSAGYAGQVWTYAETMAKATGKRAAGCFVHLVTQGIVVAVTERPQ
jgi:ATP-dependent exoDNAse (exonuclease V) beta subunit